MKVPNTPSAGAKRSISLSRLQNEGSQRLSRPQVRRAKSIKATE